MNITKNIIFVFLFLISFHSRCDENLLFKGDSLFDLKKYNEKKNIMIVFIFIKNYILIPCY